MYSPARIGVMMPRCSHAACPLCASPRSQVSVLLVGMKADVPDPEREVNDDEAAAFAEENGWLYFSASAKSGLHGAMPSTCSHAR